MTHSHSQSPIERFLLVLIGGMTFFAVLAYGLTTTTTRAIFDIALMFAVVLWVIDLVSRKRVPSCNRSITVLLLLLAAYGWIAVLNAEYQHTWEEGFAAASPSGHLSWLPSSINRDASKAAMMHLTALGCGLLMVMDLCRLRRNRRVLLGEVALMGLVVALIGIFQKASGTQTMLFFDEILTERRFFASYRYHGNAATLLNFCWPVSFVFFLRAKLRDSSPTEVAVWAVCFVFTLIAVFVNTSKIGQVIGIIMIPIVALIYRKSWMKLIRLHPHPALAGIVIGGLFLTVGFFLVTLSFSTSLSRWLDFDTSANLRLETYSVCLNMLPMSGALGLGPGAFPTMFPYFQKQEGVEMQFFWHTAHQDYLQTVLEWGWIGACAWIGLFGVIVFEGLAKIRARNFYAGALMVGLATALIQAGVDFPLQIASLQWITVIFMGWMGSARSSKRRLDR